MVFSDRLLSYPKKKKKKKKKKKESIAEMTTCYHSLSLAVIHCHTLSLAVPLVATPCTTLCHSLSLAVQLIVTY